MLKKLKSDRGDALVVFLCALPFILLAMGFVINLSLAASAATDRRDIAQKSVETAVKKINSNGSLGNDAVQAFVTQYRIQSGDSKIANKSTGETGAYNTKTCATGEVNGVKKKMPYMVVKLGTARGTKNVQSSVSWVIEGKSSAATDKIKQQPVGSAKYRVISATVYSTSTNLWGGVGLADCQVHKTEVSAIAFGSNEDL